MVDVDDAQMDFTIVADVDDMTTIDSVGVEKIFIDEYLSQTTLNTQKYVNAGILILCGLGILYLVSR